MFRDREDAGQQLAQRLKTLEWTRPLVLGIPRGGVPVAAVVARALGVELDVVLSRKVRAPRQPELAIGAVAEDGNVHLSPTGDLVPGVTEEYIAVERGHQLAEIRRRQSLFRAARPMAAMAGRSVVVIDDGVATGETMLVALKTVRAARPHDVIVAVPVGPPSALSEIDKYCDQVISLEMPESFWAISQFYEEFDQVTDEMVAELLRQSMVGHNSE